MAAEESTNIKVAIRCRPLNAKEIGNGDANCVKIQGNTISLWNPLSNSKEEQYNFGFDLIFDEHSKQEDVWATVGVSTLVKAFGGYNATIFAYGQTGSGKTWTMQGGDDENIGIIPRMSICLFENIAVERSKNSNLNFLVTASYFEIYNEILNDLLDTKDNKKKPKGGLEIKEHPILGVYIKNLTEIVVDESSKLQALIDHGTKNRKVAMTNMNADSSRSHSILTLVIHQKDSEDESRNIFAKVNLVDLAGSERQKSTNATGSTLKEGANINKSLSALGNVINALVEASNNTNKAKPIFIPYRNSKLTRVLQESLGGNSVTVMLAMLSSSYANLEESLSCLKYANRAKDIKVKVVKNEESSQLTKLNEEIRLLKEKLATQSQNSSTNPDDSDIDDRHRSNLADLLAIQQKSWQEKLELSKQYELERKKFESEHKSIESQMKLASENNWKLLVDKNDLELTMNHIKGMVKRLSLVQDVNVSSDLENERKLHFNSILNDLLSNFQTLLRTLTKNEEKLREQVTICNLNVSSIEKEFNKLLQANGPLSDNVESAPNSPAKGGDSCSSPLKGVDLLSLSAKILSEYDHTQRLNNNGWKILRDKLNSLRVESVKLAKLQNENFQIISQIQRDSDLFVQYLHRDNVYSSAAVKVPAEGLNIETCWTGLPLEDQVDASRSVDLLQRQVHDKLAQHGRSKRFSRLALFNIAKYGSGVMRYLSYYFTTSSQVLHSISSEYNDHQSLEVYMDSQRKINRDYEGINSKLKSTIDLFESMSSHIDDINKREEEELSTLAVIPCTKIDCSINSQIYVKDGSLARSISVESDDSCWFSYRKSHNVKEEDGDVYVELVFSQLYSFRKLLIRSGLLPTLTISNEAGSSSHSSNSGAVLSLSAFRNYIQSHSVNGISILNCNETIDTTTALVASVTDWEILVKKTPPEKFLRRPPVKFVFDIVMHYVELTSMSNRLALPSSGGGKAVISSLFPAEVAKADWDSVSASKASKMQFMDCVLSFITEVTRSPSKTNSNNIVTGSEGGLTNIFLQELTLVISAYKAASSASVTTKSQSLDVATWVTSAKVAISTNGIDWENRCDCEFDIHQGDGVYEFTIPSIISSSEGRYIRIYPKTWDFDRSIAQDGSLQSKLGPSMRISAIASLSSSNRASDRAGSLFSSGGGGEGPATDSAACSPRLPVTRAVSPRPDISNDGTFDEGQVLAVLLSLQESCRIIIVMIDFLNSLCEFQSSKKQEDALKRLEGLKNDQKSLETEKESLLKQVQDLLIQLQLSQEQNFTLRSTNDELCAENTTLKSELDLLIENKSNLIQTVDKLNENNTILESEVDALKVKLDCFESADIERNMMLDQLQVIKEERDNSRMNEEVLFVKVAVLTQELELLQDSYVVMTDRLNEAMDENMDLQDKLEVISSPTKLTVNTEDVSKAELPAAGSSSEGYNSGHENKSCSSNHNATIAAEASVEYEDDFDGYDDEFETDD